MSGLKIFRGFGGKVHIKRNQVLLINKASKIASIVCSISRAIAQVKAGRRRKSTSIISKRSKSLIKYHGGSRARVTDFFICHPINHDLEIVLLSCP